MEMIKMNEQIRINTKEMEQNYIKARNTIWDTWINVRKRRLINKFGIEFEVEITSLSDDIRKYRKTTTDDMIKFCLTEIDEKNK
jgi:hypothetical protein